MHAGTGLTPMVMRHARLNPRLDLLGQAACTLAQSKNAIVYRLKQGAACQPLHNANCPVGKRRAGQAAFMAGRSPTPAGLSLDCRVRGAVDSRPLRQWAAVVRCFSHPDPCGIVLQLLSCFCCTQQLGQDTLSWCSRGREEAHHAGC